MNNEALKLPTEIIDLPSKGLIYPEGNPLSSGQIEMKYMSPNNREQENKFFRKAFINMLD
jgi:hypothetical protein